LNPGAKTITSGVQEANVKSVDRLAVLDEGMTFHPAITPQEMQIIETQASIEEVARMFNIAPHKIKALQQSTIIISSSKHSIML
jgi:phage portal protein BeeE